MLLAAPTPQPVLLKLQPNYAFILQQKVLLKSQVGTHQVSTLSHVLFPLRDGQHGAGAFKIG